MKETVPGKEIHGNDITLSFSCRWLKLEKRSLVTQAMKYKDREITSLLAVAG